MVGGKSLMLINTILELQEIHSNGSNHRSLGEGATTSPVDRFQKKNGGDKTD